MFISLWWSRTKTAIYLRYACINQFRKPDLNLSESDVWHVGVHLPSSPGSRPEVKGVQMPTVLKLPSQGRRGLSKRDEDSPDMNHTERKQRVNLN